MNQSQYNPLAMRTICPQGFQVIDRLLAAPSLPPQERITVSAKNTALLHGCIGLAGEAGELAEALSKWLNDGAALDRTNVIEELGDCEWYAAEIQTSLDVVILPTPHATCVPHLSQLHQDLCVQTGILMTVMQRWLYYGKGLDQDKIKKAVSHILGYTCEIAAKLGTTISEVREKNIAKLRARYPEKFTEELAAEENRDRVAERKVIEGPAKEGMQTAPVILPEPDSLRFRAEDCCPTGNDATLKGVQKAKEAIEDMRSQTGAGWAEPPEETSVEQQVRQLDDPNPYTARELQREPMIPNRARQTASYPNLCRLCKKVATHKTNSLQICPDCMATIANELRREEPQNVPTSQP